MMLTDERLNDVLFVMLGRRMTTRLLLQQRLNPDVTGRTVELITFDSGHQVIVKSRNDRPYCRETLIYKTLLGDLDKFSPRCLGGRN